MKYRGLIASVLMMAMLFGGCQADAAETKQIAEYYKNLDAWQTNVDLTVDLGTYTADFTLAWDVNESGSRFTVLAPTEIAGLGVTVSADGQKITYEDAAIVLPHSDGTQAPMPTEALSLIYDYWRYGIRAAETTLQQDARKLLCIDYQNADGDTSLTVSSRFDTATLYPTDAEVFHNGVRVVACTFRDFAPQ